MNSKINFIVLLVFFSKYGASHTHQQNSKRTSPQEKALIVETSNGKILGKHGQTDSGTKYIAFQGVPYAKPPTGDLRFELPQEYSWKGTWNATFERNECVQSLIELSILFRGNEDCLYLNIYTRQLNSLKPVMVWIHGGGFLTGSGNRNFYGPDYFIEKDVVVVTINYRLGVFGFLSNADEVVPGNNGLKDQIFALKWVQKNIASFGGDPKKVTIMGESAGARSVGYLIQSYAAKGLFQQGILQSGGSINGLLSPKKAKTGFRLLGAGFGVNNASSKDVINKLKTVDYVSLLLYSLVTIDATTESKLGNLLYAPVLENKTPSAAITKPPYEQLKECKFSSVPIVVGFNSEEALIDIKMLEDIRYNYIVFDQNPENLLPKDFNIKGRCDPTEVGFKIKEHYVGKNGSFVFSPDGVLRYVSDSVIMRTSIEYAKLYSNCNENTYLYRFSYNGGKNTTGAGHADELRYLFSTFAGVFSDDFTHRKPLSETEQKVSDNMVNLWSNFMKFRNPTPVPNKFGITWNKSVTANNYEYLDIDKDLSVSNTKNAPFKKDLEFWESLYKTCGRIEGV